MTHCPKDRAHRWLDGQRRRRQAFLARTVPTRGKADTRKQFRVQRRAAETQRLGLPDNAQRGFSRTRRLRPPEPWPGNQPGLDIQPRPRIDGDWAAPGKAAVGVSLFDGGDQCFGLLAPGIAAPTDARGPQFVVVPREDLQVRHVPQRPCVDEHVFQARADGQIAEDVSGIGYTAAPIRIDAKIQIVTAPHKPPRLRIVCGGRGNARAQNAFFRIPVHGPRLSICDCSDYTRRSSPLQKTSSSRPCAHRDLPRQVRNSPKLESRSIIGTQFTQSRDAIQPFISVYFTQSCRICYTMRQRSSTEWTPVVSERSGDGMLPVVLPTRFSLSSESFRQLASLVPAGDRKTSRRTTTAAASRDNWNRRRSGATAAKRAADDRLV